MLLPDDVIDGKYKIVRLIGKGGMGAVYEGENLRIHRKVAIKVLHASVAEDQGYVQRFEREAQAAGRIGSDHIVEVLDLGDLPSGDRYMVMEFLEGESLRARMTRLGKMQPVEIVPIVCDLLDGLADAHVAGIIHRDLKPDNVFLVEEKKRQADFVKIVDFGVSKFRALNDQVTQTGVIFGTPHYMSPEQAKGDKHIDHRSDLYAVGVILYRALSDSYPFNADTFNELMFKVVLQDAPPLHELVPEINDELAMTVHKAMERDPDARFQSADEMAGALREWLNSHGFATSFQRTVPTRRERTPAPVDPAADRAPSSGLPTRVGGPSSKGDGGEKSEKAALSGELSTRMTSSRALTPPPELAEAAAPKKSRVPLIAAAAAVLLGAGAWAATRFVGATANGAAPSVTPASSSGAPLVASTPAAAANAGTANSGASAAAASVASSSPAASAAANSSAHDSGHHPLSPGAHHPSARPEPAPSIAPPPPPAAASAAPVPSGRVYRKDI